MLKYFLCHSHCLNLVELHLSWNQRYIWGKILWLKRTFQNHFTLFPCLFTLGLYIGRLMNALVYFFTVVTEVQVAIHSVLNLPQQSGTVGFAARCYFPQKYFAMRQCTVNRGWMKWARSRWLCYQETHNSRGHHAEWHLQDLFRTCC